MSRFIFIVCVLWMFIGCKQNNKAVKSSAAGNDSIPKERMIVYTVDSTSSSSSQAPFLHNFAGVLGLRPLSNITDGTAVRIWVWNPDSNYVVTIINNSLEKKSNVIEFYGKEIDKIQYIGIRNEWSDIVPKSGWKNFFYEMQRHQILTVKTGKPLEEMDDYLTHPSYIQFEIANGQNYRFYEYLDPFFYRYVDSGSNHIHEFLKYVNAEMNIPIYKPTEHLFQQPKKK